MDPNSTEALRHCRYLRHYKRMNQTEKIAARYARNSCWQSKPFSVQEEFRALNRHGFVPSSAYWISSSFVRFLYTQIYMYCSENGGWFKKRNDCQLFSISINLRFLQCWHMKLTSLLYNEANYDIWPDGFLAFNWYRGALEKYLLSLVKINSPLIILPLLSITYTWDLFTNNILISDSSICKDAQMKMLI